MHNPEPTEATQTPGLEGLCCDCEDSAHPDLCPTAYVSCPRMQNKD